MSKYRSWAKGGSVVVRKTVQAQEASPPQVVPSPHYAPQPGPQPQPEQLFYAPPPNPTIVQVPSYTRVRTLQAAPMVETTMVVKPDASAPDSYANLMAAAPDLARAAGYEDPKVDAMRLAGRPEKGEMRDWKPTTRYYNGVTDQSAQGRIEEHGHVATTSDGRQHRVGIMEARTTDGMATRGTSQGGTGGPVSI